jgi:polysaccharide biosynthesis protein PslH
MIATGRYDIVFLCGFSTFLYFDLQNEKVPYIVDICDSISLYAQSAYKKDRRPLLKLRNWLNYIWACRYEKLHASTIQNMILISDLDAAQMRLHCTRSNIWVIPNGVDTDYFKPSGSISRPHSLLFTGVMDYTPNDEAMLYFLGSIFPLVKKRVPDAVLTIAGKNPTSRLKNLASQTSEVQLTGFVEDLRSYFDSAAVFVSPLLSGAGMKNKVLEAWSMALPVVATSVSCSGLAVRNNENILIADKPAEIADRIVDLLVDRTMRENLSRNGRETVERNYSWSSRSKILHSIFDIVIADGTARALGFKPENG